MIQSKLFRVEQLNDEKKTYLHDCKPIICEKNKLLSYWESLSLHEKEKIFMVYDLNIIDELVEILNIARTRIATTKFYKINPTCLNISKSIGLKVYLTIAAIYKYFANDCMSNRRSNFQHVRKDLRKILPSLQQVQREKVEVKESVFMKMKECILRYFLIHHKQEFERKSGQILKMPEKKILLEYLYFDMLGIFFNDELLIKKFLKSLCLIFNKVTNDVHEKHLQNQDIPECTDSSLIQSKKKVLKFKIRSLISLLDTLEVEVDQFCSGEKVIIRKRHYSTLYSQLVKNPLPKNPSSDEIRLKIREITGLLSIMLENNLIKAYKKANKYYFTQKKESQKSISATSSAKVSVLVLQTPVINDKFKIESNNKENNNGSSINVQDHQKEELLLGKKSQSSTKIIGVENNQINQENANIIENLEEIKNEEQKIIKQVEEQIEIVNPTLDNTQNNNESYIPQQIQEEIIIEQQKTDHNVNEEKQSQVIQEITQQIQQQDQQQNEIIIEGNNTIINDNGDNHVVQNEITDEQNLSANELQQIQEKQKLECFMEIEKEFQLQNEYYECNSFDSKQKSGNKYKEDDYSQQFNEDHLRSLSSSPGYAIFSQDDIDTDQCDKINNKSKKKKIKKYNESEVETISKKLCFVNVNSLLIRLDSESNEDERSIFDSDEEYYEPDERENFHYNQDFKDYDIVDVLGENFKFDPNFSLSKERINQLLLSSQQQQQQQQQYQYHGGVQSIQQQQLQQPSVQSSSGKKLLQINNNIDQQKSIYSDDSFDEQITNDRNEFNKQGKYYGGHNSNSQKGRQQQQNFFKQDQMHQMMPNMPFQAFNPPYSQLPFILLLNQNMMMNNQHVQMPQQTKYKNSNKHPKSNNPSSNSMSSSVIHPNPNNIVSSNRKNNQTSNDYSHFNNAPTSNNISTNNNSNSGYTYSSKGQRNNNTNNSSNNASSSQSQSSHSNQGYRKKRFNSKGNNQ